MSWCHSFRLAFCRTWIIVASIKGGSLVTISCDIVPGIARAACIRKNGSKSVPQKSCRDAKLIEHCTMSSRASVKALQRRGHGFLHGSHHVSCCTGACVPASRPVHGCGRPGSQERHSAGGGPPRCAPVPPAAVPPRAALCRHHQEAERRKPDSTRCGL